MSLIKKLAGQTLWYGLPTIASRFLGYLLNVALFYWYKPSATADITQIYALIPFFNIIYTYGLETSFFRFALTENKKHLFNVLNTCLVVSTIILTALFYFFKTPLAAIFDLQSHPEFFTGMLWILLFDTLSTLAFAQLRLEGKPQKYALIKVLNIVSNIVFVLFFLVLCPKLKQAYPSSLAMQWYNPQWGLGYYIWANVVASLLTLLLLWKQFLAWRWAWDKNLLTKIFAYSYPLIIVGLGGMINEMMSRLVYTRVLTLSPEQEKFELGVFGANYKLAVLITIFIQVFKLAAEPFFFKQSTQANAPQTYARVMQYFIWACCFMFLGISLYLNVWGFLFFHKNPEYATGLHIVPILSLASVFLGIYYNLSVWYKLSNQTLMGAYITVGGAVVTILLNIFWIPKFGYTGSACATLVCYTAMMAVSWYLGQRNYPVPYKPLTQLAYIGLAIGFVAINFYIQTHILHQSIGTHITIPSIVIATIFLVAYAAIIYGLNTSTFRKKA